MRKSVIDLPVLLVPTEASLKALFTDERRMFSLGLSSFERAQAQLSALAPLNLPHPFVIIGLSVASQAGGPELHEIQTTTQKADADIAIDRYIEFPAEYQQAGIGILNYFSHVLRQKYPEQKVTVKISQSENMVRMTVVTADGNRDVIEKAFAEYGLVIRGEIAPEQFATSPTMLVELRNELRIANLRIESQREILALKDVHIDNLTAILKHGLTAVKNVTPIEVHVCPTINVTQNTSQHVETNIQELGRALDELAASTKDQPDLSVYTEGLADAVNQEVEKPSGKPSGALKKVHDFLEKMNDTQSTVRKVLDSANGGIAIAQRIAKAYNLAAPFVGLPQVPEILLKKRD